MQGFFKDSLLHQPPPKSLIPKCGACGLWTGCKSPKMKVSGGGKRKILLIGEAPGADEDEQGKQFVGVTGRFLRDKLDLHGIDMRDDCWMTNSLICRPPNNATPTKEQIDYCHPNLTKTIQELDPEVIIPLGASATQSLLGGIWKEDIGSITKWVGLHIRCSDPNAWICPTYHPSFIMREKGAANELWFGRHLKDAVNKVGSRPWKVIPDYKKEVRVIMDDQEAADCIDSVFTTFGRDVAFDYETTSLKPDSPKTHIVCCSLSNGVDTIAFPWQRLARKAMGRFLRSDVPKIASNLKFEERWTLKEFKHGVSNWAWDTMLAAHWLDHRSGITSIKFQSFVLLGCPAYNSHLDKHLKSDSGNTINQILEGIDLRQLLLYCGLDSLLEWKVSRLQMRNKT